MLHASSLNASTHQQAYARSLCTQLSGIDSTAAVVFKRGYKQTNKMAQDMAMVAADQAGSVEGQFLTELQEQKEELLTKVQTLKTDLQDWRTKLEAQVKTYRSEIGELRQALSKEVDELRSEFGDLKAALKQQIAAMNAAQTAGSQESGNDAVGAH